MIHADRKSSRESQRAWLPPSLSEPQPGVGNVHVYGPPVSRTAAADIAGMKPAKLISHLFGECGRLETIIKHLMSATPAPSAPAQARQIIDKVRELAYERGWAIGEHGSLARDIDLIAMPWTKDAVPAADLKSAICAALGYRELDRDTRRPHGRVTALLIAQNATHEQELFNRGEFIGPPNPKGQWIPPAIDLSFMPLLAEAPAQAVEVTDEMVETAIHKLDFTWPESRKHMRAALTAALATQPTEASK
jgi:hypothetical protein